MSLQTIVTNAPITDEVKKYLLERLEIEGATPDVVATIKQALQEYIEAGFTQLGVATNPNDPAIVAAQQKFDTEVKKAEDMFTEEVENAAIDAALIQAQTTKDLETLQVQTLKEQMAA